ncbi:YeeE/YedE thiosulfate transporter family protein [Pseudorhodoplanes sp.]|uniref:YeeE/YedE thiosulfate transporter family protein n=1 Tax=Pseudorhodoplanes sp. TaxID=1934341 RepID=UPI003D112E6C
MTSIAETLSATRGNRINWSPYLVGAGIGALSWIVFVVVNNPIGITTALSQVSGGVATPILGPETVTKNSYWAKNVFQLDYGTLFLIGTMLGGLLSALLAGRWKIETVPIVWAERFGPSVTKRYLAAFVGGLIAMYGARLANGCTSGNGISGGLQLALSGWVFLAVMFPSGMFTAFFLFHPRSN